MDERTFLLNRERAVDYLNMLDRLYVFDGYAGWDPEVHFLGSHFPPNGCRLPAPTCSRRWPHSVSSLLHCACQLCKLCNVVCGTCQPLSPFLKLDVPA